MIPSKIVSLTLIIWFALCRPTLAGALAQSLGGAVGIVNGFAEFAIFVGLVSAAVGGFQERSVSGAKTGLYIAGFGALSWGIAQAFFQVAGNAPAIQMNASGL